MPELLVDILNDKNNVLHVFPVAVEDRDTPVTEAVEQQALKAAVAAEIVPEPEKPKLKARPHVSRGGPLMPYGDALKTKGEQKMRLEGQIASAPISYGRKPDVPITTRMGFGTVLPKSSPHSWIEAGRALHRRLP